MKKSTNENDAILDESFGLVLTEVVLGFRKGNKEEIEKIALCSKTFQRGINTNIVYSLIHKIAKSEHDAKSILKTILDHKKKLESLLGRSVGINVSALDCEKNIDKNLYIPASAAINQYFLAEENDASEGLFALGENRLTSDLKKEIERAIRYNIIFSVIFLDVDNLSSINDRCGIEAGDLALKTLDGIVRKYIRAVDMVYRVEGDQFVIVLPNSDLYVAENVAKKLLEKIRERVRIFDKENNAEFSITVSIGLESFDSQSVQNVEGILSSVEVLLSEAKKAGKNRISIPHQMKMERIIPLTSKKNEQEQRFVISAQPISSGIAMGRAYIHEDILNETDCYDIKDSEIENEISRMKNAVRHVRDEICRMEKQVNINLGKEFSDIFSVHKTMLDDAALIGEIEDKLKQEKLNAEHIVRNVFRRFENKFMNSDNIFIRERALDIADISRKIVRFLTGAEKDLFGKVTQNRIVVAKRLLPSECVHLSKENVRAILTEKGSRDSHAAILARGLGIPYISETGCPVDLIRQGSYLIVDADKGEVIVNPEQEEKEQIRSAIEIQSHKNLEMVKKYKNVPLFKNNRKIKVMANAGTRHSIREAFRYGCDGIGLCRIEQIYMQSVVFPTQYQLVRMLDEMFESAGEKEINVRLLDIGGDKTLPYFNMQDEMYSLMGLRGIRVLLKYPRLLETELMALLKLSGKYIINIIIPMVTLAEEVKTVRDCLEKCKKILRKNNTEFNKNICLGTMIEVPAAVAGIDEILKYSDFVSIGTNDLIQYTMATARENASLSSYYEAGTEVVLDYISHVIERSKMKDVSCCLCGEMASDTNYTERLLNMGLENFSVSPANILKLKCKISEVLEISRHEPTLSR